MEITVCVSLHKDCASGKQRGVEHDVEGARDVWDSKDRGCGKDCFESIEGLLVKWCPRPGDVFLGKSSERSDDVRVVGDEFAVEVGKTEEGVNAFDQHGGFLGRDHRKFGGIHMNLTLADD